MERRWGETSIKPQVWCRKVVQFNEKPWSPLGKNNRKIKCWKRKCFESPGYKQSRKHLKKNTEVIDDNSKTGNQRTNWKYFEVFNEAYGNKTGTQAALTFDSERDEKLKKGNPKNGEGSSKKKDVKVPKSNKRKSEMEDIVEKVQAQNDKLLGTLQKQHNQKMRKMDRFLTIFEKSVGESKEPP